MCLAIPGKVVETYQEHDVRMGKVDFGGIFKRVCLEHVPDAAIDDYVLVHVGFALSRIDEAEAMRVFEFLSSMDQLDELSGPADVDDGEGPCDSPVDPPGRGSRAPAAARQDRGGSSP
jgi:hydrogenase expression/formation protein HypC